MAIPKIRSKRLLKLFVFGLGFGGSVIWIQRSMQEVADDREADQDEEPIPVVPMTEETENAMDNTVFQKLLKKLGVTPPANEQVRNSYTAFCETKIYVVLTFISAVLPFAQYPQSLHSFLLFIHLTRYCCTL